MSFSASVRSVLLWLLWFVVVDGRGQAAAGTGAVVGPWTSPLARLMAPFRAPLRAPPNAPSRRPTDRRKPDPETQVSRIFRGWDVEPHEFPWMAKIKSEFPPDEYGRYRSRTCGGALIAPEWVITARHCVTWHPPERKGRMLHRLRKTGASNVKVTLGSHSHYGDDGYVLFAAESVGRSDYGRPNCGGGARRRRKRRRRKQRQGQDESYYYEAGCPKSIFSWFMARDEIFTNDITLLRLTHPVPITTKIQPVRLPLPLADYTGSEAIVTGWGIQGDFSHPSQNLKAAELTVIPPWKSPSCRDQDGYGKLCAVTSVRDRSRGGSVCPGDSGGPLAAWDEGNGGWTLIGLLSNGAKQCTRGFPAVYTAVGDYVDWIHRVMAARGVNVP